MRTSIAVVSATRKVKPKDEDADEQDYFAPPAKVKREAFSYVASGKTGKSEGCKSCWYYDAKDKECELFEMIQSEMPTMFSLDKSVSANAGCLAHVARRASV